MCRVAGERLAGETKHGLTAKVLECQLGQLADPSSIGACHIAALTLTVCGDRKTYQRAADVMTVDEVPCPVARPVRNQFTVLQGASTDVQSTGGEAWPACGEDPRHGYPQSIYVGVLSAELFTQFPVVSVL
jgi:hypothetical protein